MSQIDYITQAVRSMKPGHDMEFARDVLMFPAPPPWTAADWILESIIGSAYEYSHRQDPVTGNTIFLRRKQPLDGKDGRRTYVSADRRHLYDQQPNGLFVLRK